MKSDYLVRGLDAIHYTHVLFIKEIAAVVDEIDSRYRKFVS